MGTEENKRLIRSFYEAGNRGDMDTCLALMDDEVSWTNIGTTKYSGTFEGKQALLGDLLGPVFGQFEGGLASTIDNVVAEGEWVVVQSRGEARTTAGRPYNNTYCHVFQLREGKIVTVTEYFDTQLTAHTLD